MCDFDLGVKRKLVLFCRERKITQAEIAKAIGVSAETTRRWFSLGGGGVPSLKAVSYLKENYGLSAD